MVAAITMTISTKRNPARRNAAAAEISQMTIFRRTVRRATSGSSPSSSSNIRASYHAIPGCHRSRTFTIFSLASWRRRSLGRACFIPLTRSRSLPGRGRVLSGSEHASLGPHPTSGSPNTVSGEREHRLSGHGVDAEVDVANSKPIVDGRMNSLGTRGPAHLAAFISVREYLPHPHLRRRPLRHGALL